MSQNEGKVKEYQRTVPKNKLEKLFSVALEKFEELLELQIFVSQMIINLSTRKMITFCLMLELRLYELSVF